MAEYKTANVQGATEPRTRKLGPLSSFAIFREATIGMKIQLHDQAKLDLSEKVTKARFDYKLQYLAEPFDRSFITLCSEDGDTPIGGEFSSHNSRAFLRKFVNSNAIAWTREEAARKFGLKADNNFVCILCPMHFSTLDACRVHHIAKHCKKWEEAFNCRLSPSEDLDRSADLFLCNIKNCEFPNEKLYSTKEWMWHRANFHALSDDSEAEEEEDPVLLGSNYDISDQITMQDE